MHLIKLVACKTLQSFQSGFYAQSNFQKKERFLASFLMGTFGDAGLRDPKLWQSFQSGFLNCDSLTLQKTRAFKFSIKKRGPFLRVQVLDPKTSPLLLSSIVVWIHSSKWGALCTA